MTSAPTDIPLVDDPMVEAVVLAEAPPVPNNALPLLCYRQVFTKTPPQPEAWFKHCFQNNGWRGNWSGGVYAFPHYHSTTHEVLGVAAGKAEIQFGGTDGPVISVQPGDVVVIPAGVAHENKGDRDGFTVVGGYPGGKDYDMKYARENEWEDARAHIAKVALPVTDPLYGEDGPLFRHWQPING